MRLGPEDSNTIVRIMNYLKFLIVFCLSFGLGGWFAVIVNNDLYIKGLYAGMSMFGLIIAFGTISFLMSLVSKDDIDAIYKMLEEELEKRREELKKNQQEKKNKKKDEQRKQQHHEQF